MPSLATPATFDLDTVPEEYRARVEAMIPDTAIAEGYVHRTIEGIHDFDYLDVAVEDLENVLLTGPTGSSKSTLFRAYAAARRMPLAVIESNASMDLSTVLGRLDPQGLEWVDGEFTLVARYGGVAIIEEINMVHPRVSAGFHQLLAVTRRMSLPENGETIHAGHGGTGDPQPLLLGGAMNPSRLYAGTVVMNDALLNRFEQPHDWPYLREVEEQLVDSTKLLDVAENIRSLAEIRTPVSTNSLMALERHYHRFGWGPAETLFVNRFAEGERNPVRNALNAESENIVRELDAA
jgi:MoxR-like ATPase